MNKPRTRRLTWSVGSTMVIGFAIATMQLRAEDVVELQSGAMVRGEIVARTETEVTVKSTVAGQTVTRKFPLSRVHALSIGGKREVVQEKTGSPKTSPTAGASSPPAVRIDPNHRRTREQVLAEIERAGRTPPEWFAVTPLNYPPTMDLTWPAQAPPGWNNQRNVGQYLWDVINPNPSRWPSGIVLLHHLLTVNQNNPETIQRIQAALAKIYYTHLNDYARAAYWYRARGAENADANPGLAVSLAECYFHLGNKEMAAELLRKVGDRTMAVQAWTLFGETDLAVDMAKRIIPDGGTTATILAAGDACRKAGRYDEAIAFYEQVLQLGPPGNDKRLKREQDQAQANIEGIRLFEKSDVARVPDGLYTAQSLGYEGQVVVEVAVRGKRIVGVRVVQHNEKQFYASLVEVPQRIIAKQSVKGVDTSSDATLTSAAIINATAKALSAASR